MGQDFVNHHCAGIREGTAVILSRRAVEVRTCPPGILDIPNAKVKMGRINNSQRKTLAIGNRAPSVFIAKVQNRPADCISQRDSLAGVIESTGVLTGDIDV